MERLDEEPTTYLRMAVFGAVVPIGSMLMGFATAVSAQTAWYLVVPVLFVGFDIPIFQAVFISVLMDLFDGVVLTFINGYGGWIDWKYGTLFGVMTAICSIPPALLLRQIIQQELEFVKFTAAFIPAVMAVAFLFKGASILRQDKKLKKELKAAEEMKEQGLNNSIDIDIDVDVESGKKKRFSKLFLKKEGLSNDEISLRLEMGEKEVIFEDESDEEIESDIKLDHEEYQKNSEYQALTEEEALRFESLDQEREGKDRDSEEMNGHDLSNPKQYKKMKNSKYEQIQEDDGDDERNGSTDPLQKDINTNFDNDSKFKSCCRKWKSREDLISTCEGFTFRKWKLSKRAIWAWSILFHAALGLFMGILYVGGGIFFAFISANLWDSSLKTAISTGVYSMAIVLAGVCCTFLNVENLLTEDALIHIALTVPFSILGSVLGAVLAHRVSDGWLKIVIGATSAMVSVAVLTNAFTNL